MLRHCLRIPLFIAAALCIVGTVRADSLISVDFNSANPFTPSPTFSGVESTAAAQDPVFATANVWNGLNVTFGVLNVNPSWTNLVDSTGASTGVSFSVTGSVGGASLFDPSVSLDPLRADFLGFNSSTLSGESTSISWQLTGLAPNTTYDMCVYGAQADVNRSFDMTIGSSTQNVPTTVTPAPPCTLFKGVLSDSSGTIAGTATGVGPVDGFLNEANWAGFQIAAVPEPSSLLLLLAGLLAAKLLLSLQKTAV